MASIFFGVMSLILTWYSIRHVQISDSNETNNNRLVGDPAVLDLGSIKQGNVEGCFTLRNKTDERIEIFKIVKSCRCANVQLSTNLIEPFKEEKIFLKWDTAGIRGVGSNYLTLFYKTGNQDENEVGQLNLIIRGDVVPCFDFEPNTLNFASKELSVKKIQIVPRSGCPEVTITDVSCVAPYIHKEIIGSHEVQVTFDPELWEKTSYNNQTKLIIKTNFEADSRYEYTISVSSNL